MNGSVVVDPFFGYSFAAVKGSTSLTHLLPLRPGAKMDALMCHYSRVVGGANTTERRGITATYLYIADTP